MTQHIVMDILNNLPTLKQLPSVVNDLISNYGSLVSLVKVTDNAKQGLGKGRLLWRCQPIFSTFIVDSLTDFMYGLVEDSAVIHIFNPAGEQTGIYWLDDGDGDGDSIEHQKEKIRIFVKGGVIYVSQYKQKTNWVSIHKESGNDDCNFFCQRTFQIFCGGSSICDIRVNADSSMLIAPWIGGLLLVDISTGNVISNVDLNLNYIILYSMTISATDVVYLTKLNRWDKSDNCYKILRIPLPKRQQLEQMQQWEQSKRSYEISRKCQYIGPSTRNVPHNIAISPHNEIFVFYCNLRDELCIYSDQYEVLKSFSMEMSQMSFRSNGALVTCGETDGIKLYPGSYDG
jgi:hypothetical protein